jgi:hypothetical protein
MQGFMGTNLLYAGVFNPGKRLDHIVAIFTCLYHKTNIPLDTGIYKNLSKGHSLVEIIPGSLR